MLFRFLFCVPLLVLGIDGLRPHHHINESMALTGRSQDDSKFSVGTFLMLYNQISDLLVILTGFGVAISSGITLVVSLMD